ncbi:MAG: T9SS type A sorting domain-containing protein [Saprospiraceae bacterium]|nr:T9SS type A sorting domain-containing protein [Saprospiraceae bacterium]
MKTRLFVLLCLLAVIDLSAQTPMFETKIYVKDAVGNRDSVTIGYDLNDILFDTAQFHEIIDNSPFDSVLEIRIERRAWENVFNAPSLVTDMYKRLITGAETASNASWCTLGGSCVLFIHAKYKPVTLSWDRSVFDPEHCRENAFFTPDRFAHMSDPPWVWLAPDNPKVFVCASKADSMVYTLNKYMYFPPDPEQTPFLPYLAVKEIEGSVPDTIVGINLEFPFGSTFSPCYLVNGAASLDANYKGFEVFPNPVSEDFTIENLHGEDIRQIQVFDAMGSLVWEKRPEPGFAEGKRFSSKNLPPGINFVTVWWGNGLRSTKKIIKHP